MPKSYVVTFYRELLNDQGDRFLSKLWSSPVKSAQSKEEALAVAIEQFEKKNKLSHWSDLATKCECSEAA
jgi:hypothetical protein